MYGSCIINTRDKHKVIQTQPKLSSYFVIDNTANHFVIAIIING